jgi:hypothetical protein
MAKLYSHRAADHCRHWVICVDFGMSSSMSGYGPWLCENSGLFRKRRKTFSIRSA